MIMESDAYSKNISIDLWILSKLTKYLYFRQKPVGKK